jgi:hypothetical protein
MKLIKFNVEEISAINCFQAEEIGYAREEGKIKIFA